MGTKFLSARVAGLCGIAFFLLTAVPGFASGAPPDPSDPAAKFLTYFHDNRSALLLGAVLGSVGTFFALFFFAKWIATLRRAEGDTGPFTLAAVLSVGIVGALATVGGAISAAAAFRLGGAEHVPAETVVMLSDLSNIVFALLGVPFATFLVASGILIVGTGRLPAWLGILAFVCAALETVGAFSVLSTSGAFSPGGASGLFLGLLPLAVFVLATSILMLARPGRFDPDEAAPHAVTPAPSITGAGAD